MFGSDGGPRELVLVSRPVRKRGKGGGGGVLRDRTARQNEGQIWVSERSQCYYQRERNKGGKGCESFKSQSS